VLPHLTFPAVLVVVVYSRRFDGSSIEFNPNHLILGKQYLLLFCYSNLNLFLFYYFNLALMLNLFHCLVSVGYSLDQQRYLVSLAINTRNKYDMGPPLTMTALLATLFQEKFKLPEKCSAASD
jgi:hypothetical protein